MSTRLRDIPPFLTQPSTVSAAHYNRIKLALLRLGSPFEVALPKIRVNMVLEHGSWMGYADWHEALPLIEWTDFQVQHRCALHEPIECTLHLYHIHAPLIRLRIEEELLGAIGA